MPHCLACRPVRWRSIFAAMPMLRILTAFPLALCLAAGPAGAQYYWNAPQAPAPKPPAQSGVKLPAPGQTSPPASGPPQPPPQAGPAPYDHDLARLSEILGALHFLRGICGSNEGQKWRSEAQALIDAEAPIGDRHDQMVASFNRGYRGFQQSYRNCTPAAGLVIRRYLDEGAKIARDITARYAN
jgi:uncharacterized protein (TIGR02301 family)